MNTWKRLLSYGTTQKINVHNKKKRKKYNQPSSTKNKRICFDLDALSIVDTPPPPFLQGGVEPPTKFLKRGAWQDLNF